VSLSKWTAQVILTETLCGDLATTAARLSKLGPRVSVSAVARRCIAAALPVLLERVARAERAAEAARDEELEALREALR